MLQPFHLAVPVHDLGEARRFYVDVLGCGVGRESDTWVDFDLGGHQVVAHLDPARAAVGGGPGKGVAVTNPVDGHDVPVPHFGVVLAWADWEALAARVAAAGVPFAVEPHVRFAGQPGEQGTFFFFDPSGNALEFKSFKDLGQLFAR